MYGFLSFVSLLQQTIICPDVLVALSLKGIIILRAQTKEQDALPVFSVSVLALILWGRYYYDAFFMDKESDIQEGLSNCPSCTASKSWI